MARLTPDQIKKALAKVPEWRLDGPAICRTFTLQDFDGSIAFVKAVAKLANAANHHPDIEIQWNKVTLRLITHDKRGLTRKDFQLAAACDQLKR